MLRCRNKREKVEKCGRVPSILEPGTLYTPIKVNGTLGSDKLLQRWPYPESSANRNSKTPEYKGDGAPVFWAQ